METVFDDKGNIIEVWLSKADSENDRIRNQLKSIIQLYGTKKHKVVVFYSGKDNLAEKTEALMRVNNIKLPVGMEFDR